MTSLVITTLIVSTIIAAAAIMTLEYATGILI